MSSRVGCLSEIQGVSLVDEKPPIQEGLRIEGPGALGRVQHGAMLQLLSATRAGVAIAAAVVAFVDADIVAAGHAAEHITCRCAGHCADTGTDQRTNRAAARNASAHHGAAKAANDSPLLSSGSSGKRQAGCGDDQELVHGKPYKKHRGKECGTPRTEVTRVGEGRGHTGETS